MRDLIDLRPYENIFITGDDGHIKVHLRDNPGANEQVYEWSQTVNETGDSLIIEASRTKGFLDYKDLLETHYVHRQEETVNIFGSISREVFWRILFII